MHNDELAQAYGLTSGDPEIDNQANFIGVLLVYLFLLLMVFMAPLNFSIWIILYFALGSGFEVFKISITCRLDPETSFAREVVYSLLNPELNFFSELLFWPIVLPFVLIRWNLRSYRQSYLHEIAKLKKYKSPLMRWETAYEVVADEQGSIDQESDELGAKAKAVSLALTEVPAAACKTAVVVAACQGMSARVQSQDLIPDLEFGGSKLHMSGWTQNVYSRTEGEDGAFQWNMFRIRGKLTTPTPWSAFTDIELIHADQPDANWLRQLFVSYDLNKSWQLSLGRLYLATGSCHSPPFFWETVHLPRLPFSEHAYGLQLTGTFGEGWKLITDVTGRSGVSFSNPDSFHRPEFSFRLQKSWPDSDFRLGATGQFSPDFAAAAFDGDWQALSWLRLRATTYEKWEDGNVVAGAHLFGGIQPLSWLEYHLQPDYQFKEEDSAGSLILVNGIRLWLPSNQLSLTLDHELHFGPDFTGAQNQFFARLQFRF